MNRKVGFIGCGNMSKAIIGGIVNSGYMSPNEIFVSNRSLPSLEEVKRKYEVHTTQDNVEVAQNCDLIFLAVKPYQYATVIEQIKEVVHEDAIIIMIAAGQTIEQNEQRFGRRMKMVRTMPNTPVLVGEGMTGVSINDLVTEDEKQEIQTIFECFGKVEFVEERLMDAVSGVSGASPAYAYMFIEALADGAVLQGIPRKQAYTFAAQALLGASKMVLETDLHPGELKDQVCSPGGATIEAVARLEESGFRSSVIQAVSASVEKSKNMKG
ncbi:pyrroline-5-carboxylate reductase [Mesobacillus maritimus]|uniref:pyrroline-5-carboxylate reductase n=1 Tax=Mesobacillus maritimus TaxID=1643336 RepID=UPI0020400123|nr:pyrroline-5-carboxylate reductase [Mesobacillus maritimus]MCM3585474.1 pyrroline-5-carboxylate reductase [Mesobacillus maritimus]MCM3669733.1 pyrroline-5-carboxylate reductase [Mesobacillus maritimus]